MPASPSLPLPVDAAPCAACGEPIDGDPFTFDLSGRPWHPACAGLAFDAFLARSLANDREQASPADETVPDGLRVCKKCGVPRETSEYYPSRQHADGLDSACKECRRAYQRERGRANGSRPRREAEKRAAAGVPAPVIHAERIDGEECVRRRMRIGVSLLDLSFAASIVSAELRNWECGAGTLSASEVSRIVSALDRLQEKRMRAA